MQAVFVKGEVSNCKYHSSGHIYFTLKDDKGTVSCVMFAGNRNRLDFRLEQGQQVIVGGTVDVYERDGKYQLYAKEIILDGAGRLYEKFEQLKKELEESGMFSDLYKQPIPRYIQTLGVVTAQTGAAVRDIIQITKRRNPYVQIILYPAIVQGENAAESIVQGIHALERLSVDVMIVGRGGGSIEDLWAFNEKIVAQAVFDCSVPVISAVGHETDTTIIDYVADRRAPTPSAAAELAVADIREISGTIEEMERRLCRGMELQIRTRRERVEQYAKNLRHLSPDSLIRSKREYCIRLEEMLQRQMDQTLQGKRHTLDLLIEKLKGLSPLERLKSGFSYLENTEGRNIRSVSEVQTGQTVVVHVQDGRICAQVTGIEAGEDRVYDKKGNGKKKS